MLDKILNIFKIIPDKDVFIKYYERVIIKKQNLGQRLIQNKI